MFIRKWAGNVSQTHTDGNLPGSPGPVHSPKELAGLALLQCTVVAAAPSTLQHLVDFVMNEWFYNTACAAQIQDM